MGVLDDLPVLSYYSRYRILNILHSCRQLQELVTWFQTSLLQHLHLVPLHILDEKEPERKEFI